MPLVNLRSPAVRMNALDELWVSTRNREGASQCRGVDRIGPQSPPAHSIGLFSAELAPERHLRPTDDFCPKVQISPIAQPPYSGPQRC
jgi:hypothetical protein